MCVVNLTIEGKQCTILWYVNDNKISHGDEKVVTRIIEAIEDSFGKMVVTRGDSHVFLGMEIMFPGDGTVKTQMRDHLQENIEAFCGEITRKVATPARCTLFEVDASSARLDVEKAKCFHSITAKLLHVAPRARPDLSLVVTFFCTRVARSTVQDKGNLKRALEFIKGTIDDWFIMGADDLTVMKSWVDVSYAVHEDMKSHHCSQRRIPLQYAIMAVILTYVSHFGQSIRTCTLLNPGIQAIVVFRLLHQQIIQ
jgi:hypothetical protein